MQEPWEIKWKDYYDILEIELDAPQEEIEDAYKFKCQAYHPDKMSAKYEQKTTKKIQLINEAHEVLSDSQRRQRYDKEWLRRRSQTGAQPETPPDQPPKPVVTPDHIFFDNVIPEEKQTASFVIENAGGPYKNIKSFVSNQNSWVKIISYYSLSNVDELPLQVEIEAKGEQWNTNYLEEIIVQLDNEETRVKIELQTQSISITAVLLETKWLIATLINKVKTALSWRLPIRKRYVLGLLGLFLLIAMGTKLGEPPSQTSQTSLQKAEISKSITTPQPFTTDLYYRMRNNSEVKRLQEFLISKGYLKTGFDTGNYLAETIAAVIKYQKDKGITPISGYFGPKTGAAVNADLGMKKTSKTPVTYKPPESSKKSTKKESSESEAISKTAPKLANKVTAYVVDQHGKPVPFATFWLTDQKGKEYAYGYGSEDLTSETGYLETKSVPDGEYTLHIEKENYDNLERNISISGEDISLGQVVMHKWSKITAFVKDQHEEPVVGAHFWLTDKKGNTYGEWSGNENTKYYCMGLDWCNNRFGTSETGYLEMIPVADGEYILYIEKENYDNLERNISISGKDISLGQIVLMKQE